MSNEMSDSRELAVIPGQVATRCCDGVNDVAEDCCGREVAAAQPSFMDNLAAAAAFPLAPPPQFVLVLQDVIVDGESSIDVAGVQRPEAFDHTSPSHVVGTWIRANLPSIVAAASSATKVPAQQIRIPSGAIALPNGGN